MLSNTPAPNMPTTHWESLSPLPQGVVGFASGILNGQMIVIGGNAWKNNQKITFNNIWTYDFHRDAWTCTHAMDTPLAHSAFITTDNKLALIGGTDGTHTKSCMTIVPHTLQMTRLANVLPTAQLYSTATYHSPYMYVAGGCADVSDFNTITNAFLRVQVIDAKVEHLSPLPEGGRIIPAVAALSNRIYIFGGGMMDTTSGQLINSDMAYVYHIEHNNWEPIAPLPYRRRGATACALSDTLILLAGGFGSLPSYEKDGFASDMFLYDANANTYIELPPMPYAAALVGLVQYQGNLYLFAGEDQMAHRAAYLYTVPSHRIIHFAQQITGYSQADSTDRLPNKSSSSPSKDIAT